MRFCLITTFFGARSFGGDAVFVEHLSRALLRRGHEVDVICNDDAFHALRRGQPDRLPTPVPGLRVHALRTRSPLLSSLWIQQTSSLGPLRKQIQLILDAGRFDVLHFHNVSLIGGAEVLRLAPAHGHPVKLLTVHEHWLLCPLSSLWKFDRKVCDTPECFRCTLQRGRPPQLWRYSGTLERSLDAVNIFLCPSRHTLELNRRGGLEGQRLELLPHFLPEGWETPPDDAPAPLPARPYFIAAGRLVPEKGFHEIIPLMARFPDVDLVIAGRGRSEGDLRRLAAGMDNVHFAGLRSHSEMKLLYQGALAAIVPSLVLETFGYVAAEAMAAGIPVLMRHRGALADLVDAGGGLGFRSEEELFLCMRRLIDDSELRSRIAAKGRAFSRTHLSEEVHMARYLSLVQELQRSK